VIVIEDTAELQLEKPNLVRFEARRERPGAPALTIRELLEAALDRAGATGRVRRGRRPVSRGAMARVNLCLRIVPAVRTRLRAPRFGEARDRLAKRPGVGGVSHDDPQAIIMWRRPDQAPSVTHQAGGRS
jgi:hypothetical protein